MSATLPAHSTVAGSVSQPTALLLSSQFCQEAIFCLAKIYIFEKTESFRGAASRRSERAE